MYEMHPSKKQIHKVNEWTIQTAVLIKIISHPPSSLLNKQQLKNSLQKWAPLINLIQQIDAQQLKLSKQFC